MTPRLLLNLLLIIVAAALAAFIFLGEDTAQKPVDRAISQLDPAAVTAIQLTRLAGAPLEFSKRDGQWHISGEHDYAADDFQVSTLLALLQASTDRHYPEGSLELESMGLSPPQASVQFNRTRFDIGTTDPLDQHRYVRHGATVYLLPDRYQHLLNARYTNFIARRVLPAGAVVAGLILPDLSLRLGADNHWELQPENAGISADAIRALVSQWESARALYVREYDGQAGEMVLVTLQGSDKPLEFSLRNQQQDIVLARPDTGLQYHLTKEAGRRLLALPSTESRPP